ncbi:MAG: metal ABC transporter substrate-binding protein [Oscillospiraceae bacterium]|nr:metal ABC transporter substrate-binding protein [Oscillospiraceae bacterium]
MMMQFRKMLSLLTVSALFLIGASGCSAVLESQAQNEKNEKLDIICVSFAEYDWTKEILGEHVQDVNLIYLLENGMDLHNYQPSAKDMIRISGCDLLIYTGGESGSWVDDMFRTEMPDTEMHVIRLMDALQDSVKTEEYKEGMQTDFDHAHAQDHAESEIAELEYDEHVWLSIRNAEKICDVICQNLCELDAVHAQDYQNNLKNYQTELHNLDQEFTRMTEQSSVKTLIFGDRFPFRYFMDDYGLDYYAAFTGCSSDTEASFETIVFLAEKMNALQAEAIFKIENSSDSLAESIISSTEQKNQKILCLNSMQSVTAQEIADGASYLSIMQENRDTLSEVLH